jgi:GT2 family glycosyltransferase
LAYLDDDDLFYPHHLETLVTALETSDYRVAYTDALRAQQVLQKGRYVTVERDLIYSHDFDPDCLMVSNQFPVLCLMHEKACLEKAGLFDESLTTHEDWDLWIRLSLSDKFIHIKKITCEFSWREDGSTMTSAKTADFVRTMEIIFAKYQEHLRNKPHIRELQRQFLQDHKGALTTPVPEAQAAEPEPEELLARANEALERQDWPAAEGFLVKLTRCCPDLLEPYLGLSDLHTLQGKHQEASEVLRAARQIDPEALPLLKRLGLNCRQRGDLSGAMAAFTKAWNKNPQDPELLNNLSATCLDLGLPREGLGYYHEAIKENPQNIDLWLGLARAARQLKDQDTFEEACRQAASLNPIHPRLKELAPGRTPGRDGTVPSPPGKVQDGPRSEPERVPASIIIPTYNNLELTQNCLESIWQHTPRHLYELIVVDNGSQDATPPFLERLAASGRIRLIANEKNLGYAKACNQGARAARGDYLLMLNNDTLVTPGWLDALIQAMAGDDNVAAVGAKLLYPDDAVQHAGVVFNHAGKVYHQYRYFHRDHPAVNKTREFQVLTAACLLIRTSVFFQAGLFDENFRNGFEDVDLCLRMRQLGYRLLYNPNSVVYHLESKTTGRFERELDNSRYFREKWRDRIVPDDFIYYQEDGLRLEWTINTEGLREAVIHDENHNPFKEEARSHLNRGEIDKALALYDLALRFNPFDPRNRGLITEMETLKDLAEPRTQAVHA